MIVGTLRRRKYIESTKKDETVVTGDAGITSNHSVVKTMMSTRSGRGSREC